MLTLGPVPRKWLIIVALIVIVTAAAAAFFIYTDIQRQDAHRNSAKVAYLEKLSEADDSYAAVQGYPEPVSRKLPEEYKVWIDGYEQLLGNYSADVNDTITTGAEYQLAYGYGSTDSLWVQQNNTRLNQTLAGLIEDYDQRKADYLALATAKEQAKLDFETSYDNSISAYAIANSSLSQEAEAAYKGLKAYTEACSINLTRYKNTINTTLSAGEAYQQYLRGDSAEYESVMARGTTLKRNAEALDGRYASLQSRAPFLNVTVGATDYNYSGDLGWYEYVTFLVNNTDHPTPVWNVTAHFTLTDHETGIVKSTDDVPVTVYAQLSKYYGAVLQIEKGRTYDVTWTLSYDY